MTREILNSFSSYSCNVSTLLRWKISGTIPVTFSCNIQAKQGCLEAIVLLDDLHLAHEIKSNLERHAPAQILKKGIHRLQSTLWCALKNRLG